MKQRCAWCGTDSNYIDYHDNEWGIPVYDDRQLFEMLTLEGAQAGLSWLTILKKRENYRKAFHNFNIKKIAAYTATDVERLLADAGIVRNRLKIESVIKNARATLLIQKEFGSLADFLWDFVGNAPVQNSRQSLRELPPRTDQSDAMSKELKKRGFGFVGSTICYAFMQAVGMVNDHLTDCYRYGPVKKLAKKGDRIQTTGGTCHPSKQNG
jgi:DNA-3-methyladenine glycosylase I